MPTNPFKPPQTDSSKDPLPPATPGSLLKAALIGFAVDIAGTWLLTAVIMIVHVLQLMGRGLSESEMRQASAELPHDSALYIGAILAGALMSVAGGYVCARIARRDEYRAGLVMAAMSIVFGLMTMSHAALDEMTLLLMVTSVACNLLGVKYGAEHNRRAQAPADPDKDSSTP